MSRTPYFYLEKFNSNSMKWEVYLPYIKNDKGEFKQIDFWPWNATHDVFNAFTSTFGGGAPSVNGVHTGLPYNVSEEVKEVAKHFEEGYTFYWISYADLCCEALRVPQVEDPEWEYDEDGNDTVITKMIDSPAVEMKKRVDDILSVMDDWWVEDNRIYYRLVYWVT